MTQSTGNITAKDLWEQAWHQILTAASTQKSSFATPVIANHTLSAAPRIRTVVLRKAIRETASLYCYTDLRSTKVEQLSSYPTLSWLFWDSESGIQFTGSGPTSWLPRKEAREIFDRLPKHSRKAYATTLAPATPLRQADDGLPKDWNDRTLSATDYAGQHFGVLVTQLERAEVLRLDRDGNLRLSARRTGERWELQWMVP